MMTTRVGRWWSTVCGLSLLACGGQKPAESAAGGAERGHSAEAPVVTCGPRESYAYVASHLRCPDGSDPLGGDASRAQRARRNSLPAPHGSHILDLYEVKCEGGVVDMYVDMYGCPEYVNQLQETDEGTPEGNALKKSFESGDLEGVLAQCQTLAPDAPADERVWCMAFVPASLYALKRDTEALAAITATCSRLHVATVESDARANQLGLAFLALAALGQAGKLESTEEQRDAIIESWLRGCEVPPAQFQKVLESMPKE